MSDQNKPKKREQIVNSHPGIAEANLFLEMRSCVRNFCEII